MLNNQILIYQDYIHNNGQLYRALSPFGTVGYCDSHDILEGVLDNDVALFIIPGGADLYYCEKLNGAGNAMIRRYVEQGGNYLGICAGAYYACSSIEWAKDTKHPICGPRELSFATGIAKGPVYEFLEDSDLEKSWLRDVKIHYEDEKESFDVMVPYRAGPVLPESGTILARYAQGPAIIECGVKKGRAILSSPHIEQIMPCAEHSLYRHRNSSFAYEKSIYKSLALHKINQSKLWTAIIRRLTHKSHQGIENAA